jgi:hypothetical protein
MVHFRMGKVRSVSALCACPALSSIPSNPVFSLLVIAFGFNQIVLSRIYIPIIF